jgi:kynurenine formamidase
VLGWQQAHLHARGWCHGNLPLCLCHYVPSHKLFRIGTVQSESFTWPRTPSLARQKYWTTSATSAYSTSRSLLPHCTNFSNPPSHCDQDNQLNSLPLSLVPKVLNSYWVDLSHCRIDSAFWDRLRDERRRDYSKEVSTVSVSTYMRRCRCRYKHKYRCS